MKHSELLRKQAYMIDMAEEYGIDDWRKLVQVKVTSSCWEPLKSIDCYFYEDTERKFALGVIEGKPIFAGNTYFYLEQELCAENARNKKYYDCCSWNPPKPKTIAAEIDNPSRKIIELEKELAETKEKYRAAHQELVQIHHIGMCIAEYLPVKADDTATVRMVKEMAYRLNKVEMT